MKKKIALVVTSGLLFIYSLVEYIRSFYSYKDEWGYFGIGFDTDCLFLMLTAGILVFVCVLVLYGEIKNKDFSKTLTITALATTGFHACYGLFTLLKDVAKAVNELWDGNPLELAWGDIEGYFWWFLFSTSLLVFFIFRCLEEKKK